MKCPRPIIQRQSARRKNEATRSSFFGVNFRRAARLSARISLFAGIASSPRGYADELQTTIVTAKLRHCLALIKSPSKYKLIISLAADPKESPRRKPASGSMPLRVFRF